MEENDKITALTTLMDDALSGLLSSSDLEVQERASVMQQFVRYVKKHALKGTVICPLFLKQS